MGLGIAGGSASGSFAADGFPSLFEEAATGLDDSGGSTAEALRDGPERDALVSEE
jgi:hypothetical protein